MNWFNPELWDNIGVVGLAVFAAGFFVMSLMREWLVIGRYYRATVADREAENAELRKALAASTETNNVLTRALIEKNATDDTTVKLLTAVRHLAEGRA
ncbi:hypothetical protein A5784_35230 [Mycobacterium sp. 852013-50091_SCH5140682]|uniref:hypothetical protein n=1 Tax=Mycobacterium sp. 852013-50091_SCH5140682 TaxID=1834109 RepID=UPI0007EA87DE|nr:hypothetical protein [Mycobacterium sp. 852013-50091_SCH5140682]OBC11450.1 hypothetical protein A5784_35230 [Mycobacterium sp. 852013-50091_SCH5140682]